MSGLVQDFRFGLRQLRKHGLLTAVAVITLALAIGANTAIFSVVRTVVLASLPYADADRLMMIWGRNLSRGDRESPVSAGDYTDWKQKNDAFEDVAASFDNEVTLTGAGDPKLVIGYNFTPNYFHILHVAPSMGRVFSEAEAQSSANVTVLSDKLWRTTFHSDPHILGRAIMLDAKSFTVIGVMPPEFNLPPQTELWMPLHISPAISGDYEHRYIRVLGRLKPGVSVAEAQARMNALEHQIASQHRQTDAGNETWVEPLRHHLSGDIRTPLMMLLGAVGVVLLIASVNIAGLMLARVASRRTELAVRVAIGASRSRLLQQCLAEGLLLGCAGGALGIALALWCTPFMVAIFPNNVANVSIPRVEAIPIDAPVLAFAFSITLLTALLFSTVPALHFGRVADTDALKESARTASASSHPVRVRRALVTAEVALSLLLLTAAGLIVESFRHAYREDLGFQPDRVLGLEVFLPPDRYPDTQPQTRSAFINSVLDSLRQLPGVQAVAATNFLPLTGFWGTTDFTIEGQPLRSASEKPNADNRLVTPGYFSSMGISLIRGRDFTSSDRSDTEQVAIVNSALSRHYFGSQDPLGKVLQMGEGAHLQRWRIVGLVSDVKAFGPEQPAHADLYRPLAQVSFPLLAFTVRTNIDPSALLKAAKQAIWSVDKEQPVFDAMPLRMLAAQSLALRRVSTILIASFAILALVLAVVGLYGVIAYSVVQRTHEIGIRMALGAPRRLVLRLIARSGLELTLAGEVIGLAGSLLLTRTFSGVLYGVSPNDFQAFATAVGILTAVAFVASYIPARRAAKLDPMAALHYE